MSKIILAEQASAPDTPGTDKVAIFVDANGDLAWKDDAGNVTKIAAAGTYTLTIPATGTAALRDVAQTFSAAQTFSNAVVTPGIKPASDSTTALQLQNAAGTAVATIDTTNKRIGIGATPDTMLHLKATANNFLRLEQTGASGRIWELNPLISGVGYAGFELRDATASATRIAVDASGNIGFGATPSAKLDLGAGDLELTEMSAPGAGATNTVRIYAVDNGSGKTKLMAQFATGSAVQLAIEP